MSNHCVVLFKCPAILFVNYASVKLTRKKVKGKIQRDSIERHILECPPFHVGIHLL